MRRSSEEPVPPKSNVNDFDFGWGPRPEGSISPLPSGGRHHTISSGVATNGKPFNNKPAAVVQIDRETFPPPRPPTKIPITPLSEAPIIPAAINYHSRRPTRDQLSKKSLSLVLSDDPEGQRFQEDSKTPLMKDEKGGGRLIARQHLFHIRRVTSDYALFCAVLGIIVMIIENELSAAEYISKSSITSLTLKGIILISTAVLLALTIKFHVHEVQLFMNANSAEDWRIALTFHRCFNILFELTICGICPLPFNLYFEWTTVHTDGVTVSDVVPNTYCGRGVAVITGDVVPNTYCGRGVAVITGILGTCTSSMVVAVIARKLELSRAEKHVHNFMIDTQLTKQLKHSAANVLRETWLIYKYRRLVDKINPIKRDQRKLAENSVSLGDVAKTTSNAYELVHDIHSTQEGLALRMTAVEHQLSDIQREIGNLAEILRAAINMKHFDVNGGGDSGSAQRESLRKRRVAVDH
uniref:Calmodulin-binding domain-containing protein n=1 Tax=Panagrolaimus sp. ES5 TaxID=591445 RepID=A0AC34FLS1_9BILA